MCDCDDAPYPAFVSDVIRRARKKHTCVECGQDISIGDPRSDRRSRADGVLTSARTCLDCVELRRLVEPFLECPDLLYPGSLQDHLTGLAQERAIDFARVDDGRWVPVSRTIHLATSASETACGLSLGWDDPITAVGLPDIDAVNCEECKCQRQLEVQRQSDFALVAYMLEGDRREAQGLPPSQEAQQLAAVNAMAWGQEGL
jgi:hypothetical protein